MSPQQLKSHKFFYTIFLRKSPLIAESRPVCVGLNTTYRYNICTKKSRQTSGTIMNGKVLTILLVCAGCCTVIFIV